MSAPSKEELVEWARYAIEHAHCGPECKYEPQTREQNQAMARDIVALADENERLLTDLREEVETNVELRAKLDGVRDENERLLAPLADAEHELADCRDQLVKLRAERAECLVLLYHARLYLDAAVNSDHLLSDVRSSLATEALNGVEAIIANLRGQP